MNFNKKNTSKILLGFLMLCLIFTACKKDKGRYDFVNEVNVYDGDVYAYLKSQKQFDSLTKAIDRVPGFKDWMTQEQNLTVFALTNRSFEVAFVGLNKVRTSQNKPSLGIATIDVGHLEILMDRYVIKGKLTTDSLKFADGAFLRTARLDYEMNAVDKSSNASGLVNGGPKSIIYSDVKNSQYTKDWISTTTQAVNIHSKNAIVHIIAASHEFGFGEFVNRMNR
ncbi:hypothetical protein [Pedobacter sp.]|uniref:hypothetical protein n=1 Tax=Pedobacter sp. TaxID=1411316 RepID=UPI0031D79B1C